MPKFHTKHNTKQYEPILTKSHLIMDLEDIIRNELESEEEDEEEDEAQGDHTE